MSVMAESPPRDSILSSEKLQCPGAPVKRKVRPRHYRSAEEYEPHDIALSEPTKQRVEVVDEFESPSAAKNSAFSDDSSLSPRRLFADDAPDVKSPTDLARKLQASETSKEVVEQSIGKEKNVDVASSTPTRRSSPSKSKKPPEKNLLRDAVSGNT